MYWQLTVHLSAVISDVHPLLLLHLTDSHWSVLYVSVLRLLYLCSYAYYKELYFLHYQVALSYWFSLGYSLHLFLFTTCSCPQCILSYACGRFPLLFSVSTCHVSCLSSVFLV